MGQDFEYLYVAAIGIASGAPIYNPQWESVAFPSMQLPTPQGVFYPPSTGFTVLPLEMLPYAVAQLVWFAISVAAVVLGVRQLVLLRKPAATSTTWVLAGGLVLLTAALRWGITPLQGAPLVLGLLAFLVVALHSKRSALVLLVASFAVSFKFTIALPFIGLLLLHRRYAIAAGAVAIGALLNVVGFLRIGGLPAVADYNAGVASLEEPGTVNSPDPWDPQSSPRLDWTYLFDGLSHNTMLAHVLTAVLAVLVTGWLLRAGWRAHLPIDPSTTAVFLLPLVCLSVLVVYHHHYDISPLFVPLIMLFALASDARHYWQLRAAWLLAPIVLMMALLPVDLGDKLLAGALGARGPGFLNLAFPTATTLALIGSLFLVREAARWKQRPP